MGDAVAERTQEQVLDLPVEKIVPNPYQPRERFDEGALKDLADSIKAQGLQQPIIVRNHPDIEGTYQVVMGERRLRAHRLLERMTIKAIVRETSDDQMEILALTENLQRDDLTIMEQARALSKLTERFETLQAIADEIGKSVTYVTKRLALLELPGEIQDMLDNGKILPTHADVILEIEGADNQLEAAKMAAKLNLTADQLHGRMLRHMKPKGGEGAGRTGGVVKFAHVSGGMVRLYDALEGFDFSMLRDGTKRETLKRQIGLLQGSLETATAKLNEPFEPEAAGDAENVDEERAAS